MRKAQPPKPNNARKATTIRPIAFAAYKLLEEHGKMTKQQLADALNVTPGYIANAMSRLGIAGLVMAKNCRHKHWYEAA